MNTVTAFLRIQLILQSKFKLYARQFQKHKLSSVFNDMKRLPLTILSSNLILLSIVIPDKCVVNYTFS
jgi:hypothetical protein